MSLKDRLMKRGMQLIQDPRVMKLMSDPRVMKTVMQAIELRGKAQETFDQRVEKLAKTLNLATQTEVRELRRTLRKMERELDQARIDSKAPNDEPKPR